MSTHDHLNYPSPNYSTRAGRRVRALVLHTTAGAWSTDRDWLCNPASGVSAHYIIAPDGVSYQLVDEADAAWGNGILNKPNLAIPIVAEWAATPDDPTWPAGLPNLETVSIEVSARSGDRWMAPQRATVVALGRQICNRYGIPASAILRHLDITNTTCPGLSQAQWAALRLDIAGGIMPTNPYWDQIGDGLKAALRQRGDEPMGPERFVHDPDRPGQNITSHVDGRQRAYTYHHDSQRITVRSYEPLTPPG